jgi:DNA mismatch repair protein MutH
MRTIRKRNGWRAVVVAGALAATLGGSVRPAIAAEQYVNDFGVGLGTVLVNVLYMPVKVVYATLGGLTGGFAFVLTGGRMDTASAVWVPAMGGTYVITPSMLRGEDPIYFSGTTDDDHERDRRVEEREPVRDRGTPREGY